MEELSEKQKLLRTIVRMKKKRKVARVKNTKLTVNGLESSLVSADIDSISYRGSASLKVRKSLKKILDEQSKDKDN